MTDTFIKLPEPEVQERASQTITAYFRDSSDAAEAPTTIDYRIDCITTNTPITGWTSVSAASSAAIAIKASESRIINQTNIRERRIITVSADRGLDTETRDTAEWLVRNNGGFEE